MENIIIEYRFALDNGHKAVFHLEFDAKTMELIRDDSEERPEWATLEQHQCPHCPLSKTDTQYCPVALNLTQIVKDFDRILSYEEMDVEVVMQRRTLRHHTTAQKALSSLMGLLIATSSCPHTAFFKTMARHHLPFASQEETVCRASSAFLLAQYLLNKSIPAGEASLDQLNTIYKNMEIVNIEVANRLRAAAQADSPVNAIVILDYHAKSLPLAIDESLEDIRYIFEPYLDQVSPKEKT